MKKSNFYLFLIGYFALCVFSSGFGQNVIWQNDFSNPSQWEISNFSGDDQNWTVTSITSNTIGYSTGSWVDQNNTVTNENGYALFDSDAVGTGNGQDAIITSGSINLSASGNVCLVFNQRIRMWQTTQTIVEISTDGGTNWNAFPINQDKIIATTYEEQYNLNISSIAGGQSNVKIRFRFIGELEYAWMIDDVKVQEIPSNELSLTDLSVGSTGGWWGLLTYYQIPISQIAPIEIAGKVSNYGMNDQNSVVFSASVPETGFSSSSSPTILTTYQSNLIPTTSNFVPPSQLGDYTINTSVTGDGENNLTNNSLSGPTIKVTNNIYSRDKGIVDAAITYSGQAFEIGNAFDIFTPASLEGIQFYVHPDATVGSSVRVKLYAMDQGTGDIVLLASSDDYSLAVSDLGNFLTLPLTAPVSLNVNEGYIAMVGTDGNFAVGRSGFSAPFTSYLYNSNNATWYYTTSAPMVRMVLNSSQSTTATICEGESYTFNNQTYTEPGFYLQTLESQDMTDSIVSLNLSVSFVESVPISTVITPSYCSSPTGSIQLTSPPISGSTVYISEYYSGVGENKVVEIYNPTSLPVDLGCPSGNCSLGGIKIRNSSNQEFIIPINTVVPPLSTILISHPNSSVQGMIQTPVIDGSSITVLSFLNEYWIAGILFPGSEQILEVASTDIELSFKRKPFVGAYNSNYNPTEWYIQPLSESSLGSHLWSDFFNVVWSNGSSEDFLLNVPEGTYTYDIIYEGSECSNQSETLIVPNTGNNFNTNFSSTQQLFTAPPFAVQFTNSTPNLSDYSFSWDFGDGEILTSNNSIVFHQYMFNGQYTVTLIATNNLTGCSDTTTISDYIFCTGGVSCTHMATINEQGPIQACEGTDVWLTCNNDPSFTYQWRRNGVNINGNNNDSLLVTQPGVYTVIILVNNCPVTSNSVNVSIFPAPPTPVITANGAIEPCVGGSVTLNTGNYTTYNWSTGATTQSVNVTNSGIYNVVVGDVNGCESSSADFVLNTSFVSPPSVCLVGMDSLTNENRVVWEKPMTEGIDSFYVYRETNVSDVYTQIGATDYDELAVFLDVNSNPAVQAYRYKITALDTCGTETNLSDFHKTIHLTINAGVGGAWNLIWSHYEGIDFGSYNIYRGTDPSNIALLTTIQSNLNSYSDLTPPAGAVYYQIEIVNPNNCDPTKAMGYEVSRSNIVNNGDESGIEAGTNNYVQIYPNPTSKELTVQINAELIGKEYFLTDNTGRIILDGKFNNLKETINLEQVASGVYYMKIDSNVNLMHKVVKN